MCLPCKEIEDQQMGAVTAAYFYAPVIAAIEGVSASAKAAPIFYAKSLTEAQMPVAKYLIHERKLTREQIDRLIAQTNVSCYNAEQLKKWALKPEQEIRDKSDVWRDEILGWQAGDQAFFTGLLNEVGEWYEFAKDGNGA